MASVHASVVSIASAIFATVFPTLEMIFMNISEWCIRSCKLQYSQLPMQRCAILCWQFQQRFRMIQFWILMKKIKKKKNQKKKKNFYNRAGQDGRSDEDKQTIFFFFGLIMVMDGWSLMNIFSVPLSMSILWYNSRYCRYIFCTSWVIWAPGM